MKRPFDMASIGRTVRYRSSGTRAASSMMSRWTLAKSRTVFGLQGRLTMRLCVVRRSSSRVKQP
jgi:hypothetical protein